MTQPTQQLRIIAQPKALYRERYDSEQYKTGNRIQRYIRAEDNQLKLEYPTIEISKEWCDGILPQYIRVTSVTVPNDMEPIVCVHPYPIDSDDSSVQKDPANNALYFPITKGDFTNGRKSFLLTRKKLVQSELKSHGPLRIAGSALSFNQLKFCPTATWTSNGVTFANRSIVGQYPSAIFVNANNTIYLTNREDNTIVIWHEESVNPAQTISGNFTDSESLFVTANGDIYIDDGLKNGRVQKWSSETNIFVTVTNVNSSCYGLFVDINDTLYCSIFNRHQVVKRSLNDSVMNSNRVAAGTDCENHRVQLFQRGESNGMTVAGSTSLNPTITLRCPNGIILDAEKYLFIVDLGNHRIIGSGLNGFRCLVGCYGEGSQSNQLSDPFSLSFDHSGNMFVTDQSNHRIQKFQYTEESCGKKWRSSQTSGKKYQDIMLVDF
ncbi:unnamed protein product [Adineta steineri]|uniref:Uncharacterized protein n=1 Tax=Adineta steineri TaxID=433720 RepID=A0A814QGQ2_9BILA|nr:unnamed protein product [Adineta steineri]